LSYTKFGYSDARLNATNISAGDTIKLTFALLNSGAWTAMKWRRFISGT